MQPLGEDRSQQRADLAGVDPLLARLLEVVAEPEVVLDLDEQVGEPDGATAGVQPAVQLGEAFRLRRVGRLGRVRLEPPPVVVERDLPVVSNTFQEAVERVREPPFQALDRRTGVDGESGTRPERLADLLPLRGRQEEGLEAAEVLRAVDGEVAGLDLVAHLEEQRALPAPTVGHAVAADERLPRRRREVERCVGRDAAATRRAVFAVDPQRRQGRRGALALFVDELHPAQKRCGETGSAPAWRSAVCSKRAFRSPRVQFARSDWSSCSCASGTVDSSRARNSSSATSGSSSTAPSRRSALNDHPVDRVALRLEHVVEAVVDSLPTAVEELGVWGAMERKVRLATAVSGVSERPELAPSDRFRYGERVASQQVDVLVAER